MRAMTPGLKIKIAQAPWSDAKDLPEFDGWKRFVVRRVGPSKAAEVDLRFYMTRGLVDEIVYAAGGLEREIMTLRQILDVAQPFADEVLAKSLVIACARTALGLNAAHHASFTVMNALAWARAVEERVQHKFHKKLVSCA